MVDPSLSPPSGSRVGERAVTRHELPREAWIAYHLLNVPTESPDDVVAYLIRERSRIPRAALEMLVLGSFQRGLISTGKGAELLGMGVGAFLKLASREGIGVLDASAEDLAQDLRNA